MRLIQRGFVYQMNRRQIAIAMIGEITFMDTKVLSKRGLINLEFDVSEWAEYGLFSQ